MYGNILAQAVSETRHVIEEFYTSETEIPVIWFDAAAQIEWFRSGDPELEAITPKGGGGTNFACVMDAYREEGLDQTGLVVITDGYCGSFGEQPEGADVLWVVFGEYADEFEPPFGKVVKLEL